MTYVLLTRPEEDCQELKSKLIVPVISSPLLTVRQTLKEVSLPAGVTDLIVTSARVFEMVPNITSMNSIPVWCVGEATAAAAKAAGFETIFQVNRSAQEILERIVKECPKDTSHFAHICGSVVYVDLADALTKLGFKADKIVIYETEAAQSLTPEAETLMRAGLIQQVPFFSLRTAEVFTEIAKKSEWAPQLLKITALVHSEASARCLRQLSWKEVIIVPDLSAERITEFYKRPGDHPMKQRSFTWQLLSTIAVAAAVSVLTVSLWPNASKDSGGLTAENKLQGIMQELPSFKDRLEHLGVLEEKNSEIAQTLALVQKELEEFKTNRSEAPIPETHQAPNLQDSQSIPKEDPLESFKIFYQDLTKGSVKPESILNVNKHLPADQQLSTSVISVRDLLDRLHVLPELKRETDLNVDGSVWRKLADLIGLKVRRTELTPLKEDAITKLKSLDFSFLGALESVRLPAEWAAWVKECHQTKNALDIIGANLNQGSAKAQEESK